MAGNPPLLQIKNLSKHFDAHKAVDNVSLDVCAGDCLALVGHNGAGKTTLFKMILGLLHPTSGDVFINGRPAGNYEAIGFLPESVSFQRALTGYELLRFFARLRGVRGGTDFNALLKRVNLSNASDKRIATYSKGMRQRLGLAQALIGNPKLLILDEPTSGLDPASRRSFYTLLDELRADGTTIILSSHALSEVEAYTNRVAILRGGTLLATGPVQELARRAGLPVRLDVALQPGADAASLYLKSNPVIRPSVLKTGAYENWLHIETTEQMKLALLNELSGQRSIVADIRVFPPTLDDIYAHFQTHGDVTATKIIDDNITPFPVGKQKGAV